MGLDVRAHEVEVRLGTIVTKADGTQDLVPQEPFTVESVLVSVGRIPNTEKLNLKVLWSLTPGDDTEHGSV